MGFHEVLHLQIRPVDLVSVLGHPARRLGRRTAPSQLWVWTCPIRVDCVGIKPSLCCFVEWDAREFDVLVREAMAYI